MGARYTKTSGAFVYCSISKLTFLYKTLSKIKNNALVISSFPFDFTFHIKPQKKTKKYQGDYGVLDQQYNILAFLKF